MTWEDRAEDLVIFRCLLQAMQGQRMGQQSHLVKTIHEVLLAEVMSKLDGPGPAEDNVMGLIPRCTEHACAIAHCVRVVKGVFGREYEAALQWAVSRVEGAPG